MLPLWLSALFPFLKVKRGPRPERVYWYPDRHLRKRITPEALKALRAKLAENPTGSRWYFYVPDQRRQGMVFGGSLFARSKSRARRFVRRTLGLDHLPTGTVISRTNPAAA